MLKQIQETHRAKFSDNPAVFSAPGRVNLIGEHTDYAGGFVMPAAINFQTLAAISPRADGQIAIYSKNFDELLTYPLDAIPAKASHRWVDYPLGVLTVLRQQGIEIPAFNLTLDGNVPLGAGLSSSASIEVATMAAMLSLTATKLPLPKIALLSQSAENNYVGASCGIMDQFISCCGEEDHALLLDCRSLEYQMAPIPSDISLVIANTMVKHSHAGGEYNQRRAEVEEGARILATHRPEIKLLRDATMDDLEKWGSTMPEGVLKRSRHVISENLRTVAAAKALEAGDLETLGRLMYEAHASYRDDFEASCREADIMVEFASKEPACIGARLTGGGFGGCTINLVKAAEAKGFTERLKEYYHTATGISAEIYLCRASSGVHQVI
ncbi:galactokinase [Silvibacterium acidisoli]|uniref:galactokinase n=1 Tax=Acidobacteriaceae bacterium ZG23-2 TaxID=2883246 RepID=UPI00406C6B2E